MQFQFRDILQSVAGTHKGLLVQVVAVGDDGVDCLARSFDGTPHFFKIPASDIGSWVRTGGTAALGPKPKDQTEPPAPALPPPLNPQELLEPLPPEVKVQPLNQEEAPLILPKPPLYKPGHRRIKPSRTNPKPAPRPEVQRRQFIATVRNALGQETTVEIAVRLDDDPNRHNSVAIMKALRTKAIQRTKPFTVLGWKLKEPPPLVAPQTGSAGLVS